MSVLLPPQADPSSVTVSVTESGKLEETGVYDVPAGYPVAVNSAPVWPKGKRILEGRDLGIYGKDALHPGKNLGEVKIRRWGAYQILEFAYRPWQWNPHRGVLRKSIGGKLEIKFTDRKIAGSVAKSSLVSSQGVAAIVVNPELVSSYTGGVSVSGATESGTYLIVASDAVRVASAKLLDFAQSKADRGFTVKMVSQTGYWSLSRDKSWQCVNSGCAGGWGAGSGGDAAAEKIRTWLKAKVDSLGAQYVVLMGNPDPSVGDVPMKMTWPRRSEGDYPESPTDYFYAELTGNWDLDGNGYAGEYPVDYGTGGIDHYPEVAVGRIPYYGVVTDFDKILSK
ncbi:MAG: C25 family cysteine peptidase, partial [Fibrobacterota bacterium]